VAVVQIEHPVSSFEAWKAAFDRDPVGRRAAGVERYRIYRATDDPAYVRIDLEFGSAEAAVAFKASIEALWRSGVAAPVLGGLPTARVVDVVEAVAY
jgi:hypothetical protein